MRKLVVFCGLLLLSSTALSLSWNDLWYNKFHQGVKDYRAKDYQGAIEKFSQKNDATSHYNRGNALAFSKKYKEAIEAYDHALKLKPDMADAKYNREIIKKLLQQQQKQNKNESSKNKQQNKNQQQQNNQSKQNSSDKNKHDQKKQQGKQDQQDKQKQQATNDQHQGSQDQQQQNQAQNQQAQNYKQKQQEQSQQNKQQQDQPLSHRQQENKQFQKQLLNRVPDDPGGLLRRKFKRDFERRQMETRQW